MQFLAPLFLAALAALAVPLLLHVRRQEPRNRVPFSVVQFLDAGEPLKRRRWRIEHWLLLALRCIAFALLILAFTRPFFGRDSSLAATPPAKRLILVDTSASLRGPRFAEARREAERQVSLAGPDDLIAVATFDRAFTLRLPFDQSRQLPAPERQPAAIAALRALQPGWGDTNLGRALTAAAEAIDAADGGGETRGVIVVVSDFQRGAATADLTGFEWPAGLQVIPSFIGGEGWTNAGLHPSGDPRRSGQPVVARVTNASASVGETFHVGWSGAKALPVDVTPGQSRSIPLPDAPPQGVAELTGDDFDFDNRAWFAPPAENSLPLDYLGAARPDDPKDTLFFLSRALGPTADYAITLRTTPAPGSAPAALTVIDGPLDATAADIVQRQISAGENALLVLRDAAASTTLAALIGKPVEITEAEVAEPVRFGNLDFDDPVLRPFADPKFSNFSPISTWHYRRVDPATLPGARVIAAFDSEDPALLRVPVGRGTLFVLTTTWRPADSQLALSSKFAPFLHALLEQSPTFAHTAVQVSVGDSVPIPADVARVRTPEGKILAARNGRFEATDVPGLYETVPAARPRFTFAVNVRPGESDLSPLASADLERLGLPLAPVVEAPATAAAHHALQATELERQQKWWWWLVAAAITAFLMESALAAWSSRSPATRALP